MKYNYEIQEIRNEFNNDIIAVSLLDADGRTLRSTTCGEIALLKSFIPDNLIESFRSNCKRSIAYMSNDY